MELAPRAAKLTVLLRSKIKRKVNIFSQHKPRTLLLTESTIKKYNTTTFEALQLCIDLVEATVLKQGCDQKR